MTDTKQDNSANSSRVRVLLMVPHLGGGGAERVTELLARYLNPVYFDVHLCIVTEANYKTSPLPEHITVHRLSASRVRAAWLRILRLCWQLRPRVLLSNMAHLNFLVLLMSPLMPRDMQIAVRQNTMPGESYRDNVPYRILYPLADAVICQSQAMAHQVTHAFHLDETRISVQPNPVLIDTGGEQVRYDGRGPHLLAIGRLSQEKGFDILLNAVAIVRQYYPEMTLTLIGEGVEKDALRKQSFLLKIGVHFTGYETVPHRYFAGADLFVLPSRHEGMPNALLEAATAGLPIVATPCSAGLTDLIAGAEGVWTAKRITVQSLAEAILDALDHLRKRERFMHSFVRDFSFPQAIASYEHLLLKLARPAPVSNARIAMMIPTLDAIGGAERQVLLLARALQQLGMQISIVTLTGTGRKVREELAREGIPVHTLSMRKGLIDLAGWLCWILWMHRHKPDVVHAHLPHAIWLSRWSRLLAPTRVHISTIHTTYTGTLGRKIGMRASTWLSEMVTVVSKAVSASHLTEGMVDADRLRVVPNGIDMAHYGPAEINSRNSFTWVATGRLAAVKDYPTLLRAYAKLPACSRLLIAGTGPEETNLRQLAQELRIANRIEFLGFRDDIATVLKKANAYVLSSLWEGLPMGAIEAAASSLPTVATDGAGTREAVLDEQTGFIVPAGNAEALGAAMLRMMNLSLTERVGMGLRARSYVENQFELIAVAHKWKQLYIAELSANPCARRWPRTRASM